MKLRIFAGMAMGPSGTLVPNFIYVHPFLAGATKSPALCVPDVHRTKRGQEIPCVRRPAEGSDRPRAKAGRKTT